MNLPKMEEEILKFWEENKIFEKSVEKNPADNPFVFYEGPPTANGIPGLHHVLARAFKDIIPRYKTMKGYRVERKAGWDTHGLPVEIQVEKELGLQNKTEIENIIPGNPRESIIEFNKKCKESVWKFKDLWEKMTKRMGYWVDMEHPYITYENKYIESVWWVIAQIAKFKTKKGDPVLYQGHKVIPYCYRCGTALSSHEVAQGYQKIKDNSVFAKFKVKTSPQPSPYKGEGEDVYFLVWTTTPWTLPGNAALAVNKDIDYVKIKESLSLQPPLPKGEGGRRPGEGKTISYILAKESIEEVFKDKKYEVIKEFKGKELLGLEYEPLYATNDTGKKAYYIISGEFITTQEGTSIVHIAPAFGEDDSNVGRVNDLPTLLTVDTEGKISADVPGKGIPVKKKNDKNKYEADELIMEDLKRRGLLFKEELYEHDYPYCWRCDTPLIYYAKPSWFVRMNAFRDIMTKNNESINWLPEYIKDGRFGEWLRDAKDWAISRDRYWGTPLPIWKCQKCGEVKIVESIEEIREQLGNPNKLFLVRHGEAENNVKEIISSFPEKIDYHLTQKGKEQIKKVADQLKEKNISVIFTSPLKRARETAEIISKATGVEVIIDNDIQEVNVGELNGTRTEDFRKVFPNEILDMDTVKYHAEGYNQIAERLKSFVNEINKKYQNKNIVIISHGNPLKVLEGICNGKKIEEIRNDKYLEKGETRIIYSKPFDFHKPYIDEITFKCECGQKMRRESEVMDVWFDSGSMPTAQFHYPNGASQADKEKIESGKIYPADYISEAIDQTRGWFYTLHAIATLLHFADKVPAGNAFKNVICLGHILDAEGKKMSKSRGNIIEPMEVMNEYGADMLRWMLYTINQPGLPKRFDIKGMRDIQNRVFRMLWNSYSFFVLYASIDKFKPAKNYKLKTTNLMDKWIISELNLIIKEVDDRLSKYDVYNAAKNIEVFIDDLSNWYIRLSRKRFWKSENDEDKKSAYEVLDYVLINLSKLLAPFCPFVSEEIYKNLTGEESVHLTSFPVLNEKLVDEDLIGKMNEIQTIVTAGLSVRADNKIKVRQPIAKAFVKKDYGKELENIIKTELNVKEVEINKKLSVDINLDTEITPELKLEGQAREIIRYIQEMRKEAGFEVDNRIKIGYTGQLAVFQKFGDLIAKETLAEDLKSGSLEESDLEKEFSLDGEKLKLEIKKFK